MAVPPAFSQVSKAWGFQAGRHGASVGGQTFTRHTKIDIPVVAKLAASPAEQATFDQINAADSPDQWQKHRLFRLYRDDIRDEILPSYVGIISETIK